MYNKELKEEFLKEIGKADKGEQSILNSFSEVEEKYGLDLYELNKEQLIEALTKTSSIGVYAARNRINLVKRYIKWCNAKGIKNVSSAINNIDASDLDTSEFAEETMVDSPQMLHSLLNTIFPQIEGAGRMEDIYKCYFWLAFSGLKEKDSFALLTTNVDLGKMTIIYDNREYPIYPEAVPCFNTALHSHQLLTARSYYLDRAPGSEFLRGTGNSSKTKATSIRSIISRKVSDAVQRGAIQSKISYGRIQLSGFFFRTYQNELRGYPPNFSEYARGRNSDRTYSENKTAISELTYIKKKNTERSYVLWKRAFNLK